MNAQLDLSGRRERVLRLVAIGCLVVFVTSTLMIAVGDPWWNLFVVLFGLFVAPPVGVIAALLLVVSRRRSSARP